MRRVNLLVVKLEVLPLRQKERSQKITNGTNNILARKTNYGLMCVKKDMIRESHNEWWKGLRDIIIIIIIVIIVIVNIIIIILLNYPRLSISYRKSIIILCYGRNRLSYPPRIPSYRNPALTLSWRLLVSFSIGLPCPNPGFLQS